jgi:hypothetical protein
MMVKVFVVLVRHSNNKVFLMKILLYGDNLLSNAKTEKETFQVDIGKIIEVLTEWGDRESTDHFITSIRSGFHPEHRLGIELPTETKDLLKYLTHCCEENARLDVTSGSCLSVLDNVPDVICLPLADLLNNNIWLGNFVQASIVWISKKGLLATHLLAVKSVPVSQSSVSRVIGAPSLKTSTRLSSDMFISVFPTPALSFTEGFRRCTVIQKCVKQLLQFSSGHDSRMVLLYLSPDANPIRVVKIYGQDLNEDYAMKLWNGIQNDILQLSEIYPDILFSHEGNVSTTDIYFH